MDFAQADRLLRHWQMLSGIGRPEDWSAPLEDGPEGRAELARRAERVFETVYGGTEQGHELRALLASWAPPAPPAESNVVELFPAGGEAAPEVPAVVEQAEVVEDAPPPPTSRTIGTRVPTRQRGEE